MIDSNKIPDYTYHQLVELMGKAEAEAFILKVEYSYRAISNKIFLLQINKFIKEKPILFILIILAILYCFYLEY
jgi:hypothetical protein